MLTSVDLILPCYNPPANWVSNLAASVERLARLLPHIDLHVLVVNDGSTHGVGPAEVAHLRELLPTARYLAYSANQGKGYALRYGVQHAQHALCLFTDIDFPYEEVSVQQVLAALQAGADIAVGSRSPQYYAQVPRARIVISKLLRRSTHYLLGLQVSDTQCGLKGFNARGRAVFLATTINRYLFDLEFIYLASRPEAGLRVMPVPVQLRPSVVFSRMNLGVLLTEGSSFLKLLVQRVR
ncbi:glycosyltransferase [Hymenobacter guriensis]|uniref:Glycosyltransferase n=1 Tax=Hymenobacter guriensis TaxID=2793065 RepID=A0ABS0L2S5_9BACT|nr:glycosyltransferase [Hymenobacter guriensis]MBG8554416.1 glycosyltransferase [Hymenobacter guriensis]